MGNYYDDSNIDANPIWNIKTTLEWNIYSSNGYFVEY